MIKNGFKKIAIAALFSFVIILISSSTLTAQDEFKEKTFTNVKEIWRTIAKPQGRTGTCWCFSTTSFIESEAKRMGLGDFEISELYTVYHAYLEKGYRYLRLHSNNTLGQGGLSHDLFYLIPKYGLVRDADYSGLLEGQTGHNHRDMFKELKVYLDGILEARKGIPDDWKSGYKAILDKHIGKVPEKIVVNGKEMSPQQFAKDVIRFDPSNYVEITSYSHMPFFEKVELLVPDNWMRYEDYYNVPLDDFMGVLEHALENGYTVVPDLDVSEKTYTRKFSYAVVQHDLDGKVVSQEDREAMFNDFSTTDDHLMHFVGTATDESGKRFYLTKDSGGPERGIYKGNAYLSANYVRAKVLAIMLHKDGIPAELKQKLDIN